MVTGAAAGLVPTFWYGRGLTRGFLQVGEKEKGEYDREPPEPRVKGPDDPSV